MPEQSRVGVIGAGNIGRHHIRNYSEMPETELVAISDPDTKKTPELAEQYGVRYYKNYIDMLEDCELKAVSIAVPTLLHHEIASETITRGIHTLVEKPIAATPEEALELIDLAEQNGVILTVGHIERYNPVIDKLKAMIDSGQLGTILTVESRRIGGFPLNEPKTDVMTDLAIHDVDIINYLLGTEGELREANGHRTHHSTEIDSAEIVLDYNGVSGIILANWITPVKIREIIITGSKGYLKANYITQEITLYEKMTIVDQNTFEEFVDAFGEPDEHIIRPAKKEPMRRQLGAFALAVSGRNSELLVDPKDALSALKVVIAAAEFIKDRKNGN
ncbi:hypothetical protein A2886_03040 [candidate division WWE3 bacterium RIFCSPHIGHO2_01_FULL_42_13]|uniref:Oxidoreductase n=1 Tax=candidate division WWE3 bacterium RIFCSPHIGHO2_01_FULL_42_13 TaxID=1802617 RepID=A0A1F4UQ06_UNCKA|nr:MAG: hypothetical protein A2886_03040 [candidate division WWE3 bacterium RIFCSPHIGHO2_01_FULL_42_13]